MSRSAQTLPLSSNGARTVMTRSGHHGYYTRHYKSTSGLDGYLRRTSRAGFSSVHLSRWM